MPEAGIIDPRKMLVISDSHGRLRERLPGLVEAEMPATLVHLGDMVNDYGNEKGTGDFGTMMDILKAHDNLRYVHVSGDFDSYGPYDLYTCSRPNSFSGGEFAEEPFILRHNDNDLFFYWGRERFIRPRVKVMLELWHKMRTDEPSFLLHGHTHIQDLYALDTVSNRREQRTYTTGEPLVLEAGTAWLMNPGAFKDGRYCIVEKSQTGTYHVCFR